MRLLYFIAVYFFALNFYAQDAQTVIKKLQEKFNTIQDFNSSFKQTSDGNIADKNFVLAGKFNYKKKNKFNVELKDINLISNGHTIWNYDKKLNRVVINTVAENQSFLNLDDIIIEYPEQCGLQLVKDSENENFLVVKLVPNNNKLEFASAKIWIDKSYILNKIEIQDFSNSTYKVELTNIKINQNLHDNKFNFIVPEGCKVIDFR